MATRRFGSFAPSKIRKKKAKFSFNVGRKRPQDVTDVKLRIGHDIASPKNRKNIFDMLQKHAFIP